MKKIKIDFSKLVLEPNSYTVEVKMLVLDWMLKTGKPYKIRSGWYEHGVSQHIFGYSANEHNANFPIPILHKSDHGGCSVDVIKNFFQCCFTNAILTKPNNSAVTDWREKENIKLGKYRMLEFNLDEPLVKSCQYRSVFYFLYSIRYHVGEDKPISGIHVYTNGMRYECKLHLNGSDICIWQGENESLACFINNIYLMAYEGIDVKVFENESERSVFKQDMCQRCIYSSYNKDRTTACNIEPHIESEKIPLSVAQSIGHRSFKTIEGEFTSYRGASCSLFKINKLKNEK